MSFAISRSLEPDNFSSVQYSYDDQKRLSNVTYYKNVDFTRVLLELTISYQGNNVFLSKGI